MARLEAVLFDLGDTLVDLGEGRGSYEARLLARVGHVYDVLAARGTVLPDREGFCTDLAADSEAQYHAALREERGLSIYRVMTQYFERRRIAPSDELIEAAAKAYCTGGDLHPAGLRLGALETLGELRSRGLRLGVISNTVQPDRFMRPSLIRRGIAPFIDAQVYSSECGLAKPHPRIFSIALEQLGVVPEHAVYVGDRIVADVGGAKAAGMKGILVEVAHRGEDHDSIVPDARIAELPELLDVLPRLFDIGLHRHGYGGQS